MIELLFLDHVHKQVACHPKIFAGSVGEKEGMIGRALVLPDAPAALGTLSTALAPLPAEIAVATCSLQLPSYRDGSAFKTGLRKCVFNYWRFRTDMHDPHIHTGSGFVKAAAPDQDMRARSWA